MRARAHSSVELGLLKRLIVPAAAILLCAGSSCTCEDQAGSGGADGADGNATDDALIVPEGLSVTALPGGSGVLEMVALTLRKGPSAIEIYAALKNAGDTPACSAGFSVELFDEAEQSVAAGIGGLLTQRFYRRTDGSGQIAACVAPGDVTMAAITDLPSDIEVEEVRRVVYRCPYFALDVVPIDGLAIHELEGTTRSDGTTYTGTLVNGFDDVTVCNASVTVFPVNRVGRPLGVAIGEGTGGISPGARWDFETNAVAASGVDHAAYPAGALSDDGCPTAAEPR